MNNRIMQSTMAINIFGMYEVIMTKFAKFLRILNHFRIRYWQQGTRNQVLMVYRHSFRNALDSKIEDLKSMYHRVLADYRFSHYQMNLFDPSNTFASYGWGGLALRAVLISPFETPGNTKGTVFWVPKCSALSRICKSQFHEK